jgi:RHS repeat-associated protein
MAYNSANNHITDIGGTVVVQYDAAGNLLSYITAGYTYNYQYDAEGRLVSLLRTDGGDFRCPMYNALGQRVRELRAATPTTSQTLDYPRGIFGYRAGVFNEGWGGWDIYDTRVAGQVMQLGSGLEYFLHTDAVGSTTMDTDNTGTVDRDITFYPWGQTWQVSGSNFWENFAGLGHQANGGFYPARQREYNPDMARWPTPDPGGVKVVKLDNPQTWNMYAYVTDNPTSLNDPSGMVTRCAGPDAGNNTAGTCTEAPQVIHQLADLGIGIAKGLANTLISMTNFEVTNDPELHGSPLPTFQATSMMQEAGMVASAVGMSMVPGGGEEEVASGPALARQLGKAGEDAVGITGPKVGIIGPETGKMRFPDQLTRSTLTEVKNVQRLSYTQQLRDYSAFASEKGLRFDLYVRPTTTITSPLNDAIRQGMINLLYIP